MKKRHIITGFFAMAGIVLSLFAGSVPVQAAESVATGGMRLSRTQGTVAVFDTANKPQKAIDNMKLPNGYNVATSAGSYAWISLDDTKLVKMDALSNVKVASTGKNHVVDVTLGKAFFDISKNLEKDESLIIRTKSMVASINKGTTAEISVENGNTTIVALDGKIDCVVADVVTGQLKSVEALAGKKVEVKPTASGISVATKPAKKSDISGFSKLQIAQDSVLKDRIIKASGSKIGNISVVEAMTSVSQDMVSQATEVIAMANKSGKDIQSVINTMVGADISTKTLENVGTVTQSAPSSATSSDSSNGSTDSGSSTSKPVHTHSWDEGVVTKAATCEKDGIRTLTCTGCHQTKEETIPAAHTLGGEPGVAIVEGHSAEICVDIIEAEYKTCTVCGEEVEVDRRRKYEHNMELDLGDYHKAATCFESAVVTYRCTTRIEERGWNQCTYYEERIEGEPLGHTFTYDFRNQSESCCYEYACERADYCHERGSKQHVLGGPAPTTAYSEAPIYIDCAEKNNGCKYRAKYSWNADSRTYTLDGWESTE